MSELPEAFRATIEPVVAETMRTQRVPGVTVAVARHGRTIGHLFVGTDAVGRPLAADSLFPVASVTKLAAALAVLQIADTGGLGIDDPLSQYLPEAAVSAAGATLRQLLAHTSGLPLDPRDDIAPYAPGLDWPLLARACLETPPQWQPNTRVQYSNVGYGLLAIVVERVTGRPFADVLQRDVLEPLGIEGYLGVKPPRPPVVIADVRGAYRGTDLEPLNASFWRSLALPWAGLLTTLDGALALVQAFRAVPAGFIRPTTLADATRNQTDDLSGGLGAPLLWPRCPWGLGPELRDSKTPHWAPSQADPGSFGHAGTSGCVVWADPTADVAWAILGSRTADNGWLLRRGPASGAAILAASK